VYVVGRYGGETSLPRGTAVPWMGMSDGFVVGGR
jgi:hypothetical protein